MNEPGGGGGGGGGAANLGAIDVEPDALGHFDRMRLARTGPRHTRRTLPRIGHTNRDKILTPWKSWAAPPKIQIRAGSPLSRINRSRVPDRAKLPLGANASRWHRPRLRVKMKAVRDRPLLNPKGRATRDERKRRRWNPPSRASHFRGKPVCGAHISPIANGHPSHASHRSGLSSPPATDRFVDRRPASPYRIHVDRSAHRAGDHHADHGRRGHLVRRRRRQRLRQPRALEMSDRLRATRNRIQADLQGYTVTMERARAGRRTTKGILRSSRPIHRQQQRVRGDDTQRGPARICLATPMTCCA